MDTPNEIHMRPVAEWQNPKPIGNMEEFIARILYGIELTEIKDYNFRKANQDCHVGDYPRK